MGLRQLALLALCATAPLVADTGHMLYLAQEGRVEEAVAEYRTDIEAKGSHNFEALRALGVVLLTRAQMSPSPEEQLLAIFGAGVASDATLLPILQSGLYSPHPQVQVASVNLLAQLEDDHADQLLLRAMGSDFLFTRLEAGLHLARKRHLQAVTRIETLMGKVIPPLRPIFPQLFVMVGTPEADRSLRRLLADPDQEVSRATLLALARAGRDDFLPDIRRLSLQIDPLQQEAAAFALGLLRDSESVPRLQALAHSNHPNVRVAAHHALYKMGHEEAAESLLALASSENLYAIAALADVEDSEETLFRLTLSRDLSVRVNATASLLLRRDSRALFPLRELLITDQRDLAFALQPSHAGALGALRPFHAAHAKAKDLPALPEVSQRLREALLVEAAHLPETDFLSLAHTILSKQQTDLIPTLMTLLEDISNPAVIALLQLESQHVGAPLIRGYCNLALFRAHTPGPYASNLNDWVRRHWETDLIQLRPVVPWHERSSTDPYSLTPEESSRLLIESIEALAQRQDEAAVDFLLETLANGNPRNHAPLAGLLIRMTQ